MLKLCSIGGEISWVRYLQEPHPSGPGGASPDIGKQWNSQTEVPLWRHLYRRQYWWRPLVILDIQMGPDNTMKACAWFNEVLIADYLLNGLTFLDVKFCKFGATYVKRMTGDPFYFWFFKGNLTRIAYANFHGIIFVRYILNEFKYILRFRCHRQLVKYQTAFQCFIYLLH